MHKLNEKGFIHAFLFLLLLAGLGVGVYLVQTKTGLFSKAASVIPDKPETSFKLAVDKAVPKNIPLGSRFRVDIWTRSDIDPANTFVAKLKFNPDELQVVEINDGNQSFVNQWIEKTFDNTAGKVSIVGGVNPPGLLTSQSSGSVKGVSSTLVFDTQTVYLRPDGVRRETVTAYGKYWNWDNPSGSTWNALDTNGSDLASVDRYASGPCQGQATCSFDTQTVYYQSNGTRRETVTAYGKYWNWDEASPGQWQALSSNGGDLTAVDRYASGPCQSVSVCTFDTQTVYLRPDGVRRETVTAYGKYYNWDNPPGGDWNPLSSNGETLASVDRYASGPCQGQSACSFDTQTVYYQSNGTRRETVTAYGKYWNWDEASPGNWQPLDTNGRDMVSVDRYSNILSVTSTPTPIPTSTSTPTPVATITMCNGQVKTWAQIDSELRGADYPGPFDHSQSEIDAYNRAACPSPIPVSGSAQTCLGLRTWADIDDGLKKAKYGGPFDHGQSELDAFNRAACPSTSTPVPTPVSTPIKPTLMPPRLMASIIFEAKKTGNAAIDFADTSEILRSSDGLNIISAKKDLTVRIVPAPVSAPVPVPTSAPKATLSLDPSTSNLNRGCDFSVNVNVDTGGAITDGTDATLLYDPTRLTATSITSGKIYAEYPANDIDQNVGKIIISGLSSVSTPFTGKGILATVNFSVKGSASLGATKIHFDFDPNNKNKSTDSNVVERETVVDVLESVVSGNYTVGTGVCSSQTPSTGSLKNGDVNGNGKIDLVDLSRLLAEFGKSGQSGADLNSDGLVNTLDLLQLRSILIGNGILSGR